MLFHSQIFLLAFLPLTLAGYYVLAKNRLARQWLLILASFVFYGYWEPRLLPLLAGSIAANWLLARSLRGGLGSAGTRLMVPAGVALNLTLLGLFKYADFFAGTVAVFTGDPHQGFNVVLPLGISFFTFQQISYLVDLRRGQAPGYSFTEYALYVSFFPQLIAGPIVRHNEVIFQYSADPRRDGVEERIAKGGALLIIGMAKKMLLADGLAAIADPLFASPGSLSSGGAWLAAAAFGGQIYFDFSGYSDMAIGLGLMFGITLPANFDRPYAAASVREFWRRWHMTLSGFLRDYLYIPLGGSRHGRARQVGALIVTMLLGGLWHGAGWTFVAWGALHGAALGINHIWRWLGGRMPPAAGWLMTIVFVTVAWVPFRAESFAGAWHMLVAMTGISQTQWHGLTGIEPSDLWVLPVGLLIAVAGPTSQRYVLDLIQPRRGPAVMAGLAAAFLVLVAGGFGEAEFIYFQF